MESVGRVHSAAAHPPTIDARSCLSQVCQARQNASGMPARAQNVPPPVPSPKKKMCDLQGCSNPSRPIAERPATGERSHGARGKSLPAFSASLLDLATEHRVKLGELGRPVGDRANYRFALGGIEVDVKRSRAERSFHLGSDGRVSGPAESRDQLRYVVSIYWHTSHVDVAPQRHGERVSPARTIKTRAGGQRSRLQVSVLRVGRLQVVVPGRRMVTEARPHCGRLGLVLPLPRRSIVLAVAPPFQRPSRKGLRSPLSPLPPEAERLPTDPHRWAAATTRHGERSRAGCAGERMDAPVIGWSNGSTNAGAPAGRVLRI